jgi:steroid delta-isomerase-like uncharacterized protein
MPAPTNKAVIERLYQEVFANWNLEVVDELIDPRFIGHEMAPGTPPGPEGFKQFYARSRLAFPDLKYNVNDIIAEDDRVVVRWTWTCTHKGEFRGIPPTRKQATMTGMAVYRLENGKCVERWVELNMLGFLEQLRGSIDNR